MTFLGITDPNMPKYPCQKSAILKNTTGVLPLQSVRGFKSIMLVISSRSDTRYMQYMAVASDRQLHYTYGSKRTAVSGHWTLIILHSERPSGTLDIARRYPLSLPRRPTLNKTDSNTQVASCLFRPAASIGIRPQMSANRFNNSVRPSRTALNGLHEPWWTDSSDARTRTGEHKLNGSSTGLLSGNHHQRSIQPAVDTNAHHPPHKISQPVRPFRHTTAQKSQPWVAAAECSVSLCTNAERNVPLCQRRGSLTPRDFLRSGAVRALCHRAPWLANDHRP